MMYEINVWVVLLSAVCGILTGWQIAAFKKTKRKHTASWAMRKVDTLLRTQALTSADLTAPGTYRLGEYLLFIKTENPTTIAGYFQLQILREGKTLLFVSGFEDDNEYHDLDVLEWNLSTSELHTFGQTVDRVLNAFVRMPKNPPKSR
jgi:hypothetical protein